jgi:hypothetical protein
MAIMFRQQVLKAVVSTLPLLHLPVKAEGNLSLVDSKKFTRKSKKKRNLWCSLVALPFTYKTNLLRNRDKPSKLKQILRLSTFLVCTCLMRKEVIN